MRITLFICFLSILSTTQAQVYNAAYTTGSISNWNGFETLNRLEMKFDSLMPVGDTLFEMGAFRNNRSRIFLEMYENGKLTVGDSLFIKGMPAMCECYTNNDTLTIKTGVGFMGGFGIQVNVTHSIFYTMFYDYIDDVKPYKYTLNDTASYGVIEIGSKYQTLQLKEKPLFRPEIPIAGYLTFTTDTYYEQMGNTYNPEYVKGRIYFTCKPRAKTEWDR